jgi:hypothetical protein
MELERIQHTELIGSERDPFLHALLGLHVLCEALERLLAARDPDAAVPTPTADELPELAALGALSLRRTLVRCEAGLRERLSEPDLTPVASVGAVRMPHPLLR